MKNALWLVGLIGFLLFACDGCNQQQAPPTTQVIHLKHLAVFYGQYIGMHQGQSPPSEEEFKKFISGLGPERLAAVNATNVDELFVSPRDKQPYVIRYNAAAPGVPGMPGVPGDGGAQSAVAHEKDGVSGKRYVAFSLGQVEELDEAAFQQRVSAGLNSSPSPP